ncbi:hypothetical protein NY78_0203 [Desulfovibrio sp. TomC]|nr:hypothetical protein NY78_0203 [Desulfovibrio sp. TomC]
MHRPGRASWSERRCFLHGKRGLGIVEPQRTPGKTPPANRDD